MVKLEPKRTLTKEFLQQKYIQEGLSSAEIAAQIASSRQNITNKLKAFGIPLKECTRRQTGGTTLGFRKYGGKGIVCYKEQAVVERILDLRRQGLTPYGVAKKLNEQGVPTKQRKGLWHHHAVKEMLIRLENERHRSSPH